MRKIFFCARDIRDYLRGIMDTTVLEKTAGFQPNFPALTDAPAIQNFLFGLMKIYKHWAEGCDGEICGATEIDGVRLDFNFGLRLEVPAEKIFRVRISDADTDEIFFDREISDVRLISVEKYFIRWRVEIFSGGAKIFGHEFNPAGQKILLVYDKRGGFGDTLANLPYAAAFAKNFSCR